MTSAHIGMILVHTLHSIITKDKQRLHQTIFFAVMGGLSAFAAAT